MNVLRNLSNSVAFYSKFATFINFLKIRLILSKKPSNFLGKTPNFWTFWEFLQFQWPCIATFLILAILKKSKHFFEKPINVFSNKKLKFRTFWDIFLIQLQSASNCLLLAVSKKTQDRFWTTIFFDDETNFWTFWEILIIQLHPTTNFCLWRFLQNQFFSKNPNILFFITKF